MEITILWNVPDFLLNKYFNISPYNFFLRRLGGNCIYVYYLLLLLRSSTLIMDEVDLILHPMKSELNFPIGSKQELDFSPQRWQMPIHLIDGIFYAERGRMAVGFKDVSGLSTPTRLPYFAICHFFSIYDERIELN